MESEARQPSKHKLSKVKIAFIIILGLFIVIATIVGVIYLRLLNRINFIDDEDYTSVSTAPLTQLTDPIDTSETEPSETFETEETKISFEYESLPSEAEAVHVDITPEDKKLLDAADEPYLEEIRENYMKDGEVPPYAVSHILLIGTDTREGEPLYGHSDVMMLMSINKKEHKITITSLMRDTVVFVPGFGYTRLGHANFLGGPNLLMHTIRNNFKIAVTDFALVSFESMVKLIDAMDGVDVDVTEDERLALNQILSFYAKEMDIDPIEPLESTGQVHLNGHHALSFARIRSIGSDFGRTERQRKIINAMATKLSAMSLTELYSFAEDALPLLSTNLNRQEITGFVVSAPQLLGYRRAPHRVPARETFMDQRLKGMAVLSIDFQENIKKLWDAIY